MGENTTTADPLIRGSPNEKLLLLKEGLLVNSTSASGGCSTTKFTNTITYYDSDLDGGNGEGTLSSGMGIKQSGRIYSRSREYYVTLEDEGNVVLYRVLIKNVRDVDRSNNSCDNNVVTDRVSIWSSCIPEPPPEHEHVTHYKGDQPSMYDNYHGPYSLVMQRDGNLALRYYRESCILPGAGVDATAAVAATAATYADYDNDANSALSSSLISEATAATNNSANATTGGGSSSTTTTKKRKNPSSSSSSLEVKSSSPTKKRKKTVKKKQQGSGGGVRMVKTEKGFAYWVEEDTDVIVFPKIAEYSLGISNTGGNYGAKFVVTDWGEIFVYSGSGTNVLWRRGS